MSDVHKDGTTCICSSWSNLAYSCTHLANSHVCVILNLAVYYNYPWKISKISLAAFSPKVMEP